MGLYIIIKGKIPCPQCGKVLPDWQCKLLSYDGYPVEVNMQEYTLNKKMSGQIHAICEQCGYVEYQVSKGKLLRTAPAT